MDKDILFHPDLAEPIFLYVLEHTDDFRAKSSIKDLSPLEYVYHYAFEDFVLWLKERR